MPFNSLCTFSKISYFQVDVNTEKIIGGWVPFLVKFSEQETPLIGRRVPGVKKACRIALQAHRDKIADFDGRKHFFAICQLILI